MYRYFHTHVILHYHNDVIFGKCEADMIEACTVIFRRCENYTHLTSHTFQLYFCIKTNKHNVTCSKEIKSKVNLEKDR